MGNENQSDPKSGLSVFFWITSIRAVLVIVLGLSLFLIPDKTRPMLFNFMGLFWLMGGILIILQQIHKRGDRVLLAAGVVGVLTGVLVVTRKLSRMWLEERILAEILGVVIILTGILHIIGGIRLRAQAERSRTTLNIFLGVFEILLGGLLLFTKSGQTPFIYAAAIIWSLLGGAFLALDAFRQYRKSKSDATV